MDAYNITRNTEIYGYFALRKSDISLTGNTWRHEAKDLAQTSRAKPKTGYCGPFKYKITEYSSL